MFWAAVMMSFTFFFYSRLTRLLSSQLTQFDQYIFVPSLLLCIWGALEADRWGDHEAWLATVPSHFQSPENKDHCSHFHHHNVEAMKMEIYINIHPPSRLTFSRLGHAAPTWVKGMSPGKSSVVCLSTATCSSTKPRRPGSHR